MRAKIIYHLVQAAAAVSIVWNLKVVRYSGAAFTLHIIIMEISVGACSSVRYSECPLIESPLYLLVAALAIIIDNRNIMW